MKRVKPRMIRHGQALRLKAKQAFVDNKGQYVVHCYTLVELNSDF